MIGRVNFSGYSLIYCGFRINPFTVQTKDLFHVLVDGLLFSPAHTSLQVKKIMRTDMNADQQVRIKKRRENDFSCSR